MSDSEFDKKISKQLSSKKVFEICVKEGLIKNGKKQSKEPEVNILGEGKGLCSNVYGVKFFLEGDDTYSLVAKIPTTDKLEEQDKDSKNNEKDKKEKFEKIRQLHDNELQLYRLIKNNKNDLKIPKFIDGLEMTEDQEGYILMEDFMGDEKDDDSDEKHEGFENLTDQQLKEAIIEIAKLQAFGFTIPDAKNSIGKLDVAMDDLTEIHHEVLDKFADLELDFVNEDVIKLLKDECQMDVFQKNVCSNKLVNLPEVLSHNDFWTKNIIFSPKTKELIRIIDWQTSRFASPTHDLAALLSLELNGQQRRELEKYYVEYYHEQVVRFLDEYGVQDDQGLRNVKIYDLMEAYKGSQKIAIFGVIFTLMESEAQKESKEAAKNSDLVERIQFLLEDLYPFVKK